MNELNDAVKLAMTAMLIKFNNRLSKNQMEPESKLADWADFLAFEKKFTVSQVAHALASLVSENTKFMPSAYEIADALKPKQDTSEEIGNFVANEVIQKVIDLGYHRLNLVYEQLSTISQLAIGENRYILTEIANSDMDQLPTIRAQLRNMAKSAAEMAKSEKKNAQLEKIGIVLDMKKPEMKRMDFQNFLPSEPAWTTIN